MFLPAAGPVNKRRRGFFTKPTENKAKQATDSSQQAVDRASKGDSTNGADAKSSETADKGSAGNVFRNVIHELKDRNLPVEMHYAHTGDKYWIPVVRIPAKGNADMHSC